MKKGGAGGGGVGVPLTEGVPLVRNMLEELMDDQEDIGDINLSSRPKREEIRRQRDRYTTPTWHPRGTHTVPP